MIPFLAVNIKYIAPRQGGAMTVEGRGYEPYEAVRCLNTNCLTDDDDTITCGEY